MNPFTREIIVRFEHCDAAGIMFYPRFFALVNECVEDWFATLGYSFKTLHVDQRKGVPTVRFESEFVAPVRMGDVLKQSLGVEALGNASLELKHLAVVGDRAVARFDQTLVFTDLASMKAEPWPDDLRAAIAKFAEIA
ncbi:MAG: acyl-CoA thioesterase [Hyphomonadaceae bacterium]|nr:acyl-CoA thioesterase [Hyphomonadaceae bacterium]